MREDASNLGVSAHVIEGVFKSCIGCVQRRQFFHSLKGELFVQRSDFDDGRVWV